MRKMWFDEERLNMYYVNRFASDLEDYFSIPRETTGFKYVGEPRRPIVYSTVLLLNIS